mmetsp:Transcript_23777/g.59663  ORF Transcript_23777/g.59663 Transcript_23777/m.59663 type:complete len:220 (+) Transcript_23777:358-1017(+)
MLAAMTMCRLGVGPVTSSRLSMLPLASPCRPSRRHLFLGTLLSFQDAQTLSRQSRTKGRLVFVRLLASTLRGLRTKTSLFRPFSSLMRLSGMRFMGPMLLLGLLRNSTAPANGSAFPPSLLALLPLSSSSCAPSSSSSRLDFEASPRFLIRLVLRRVCLIFPHSSRFSVLMSFLLVSKCLSASGWPLWSSSVARLPVLSSQASLSTTPPLLPTMGKGGL